MKKKPLLKLSIFPFITKKGLCTSPGNSPGKLRFFAKFNYVAFSGLLFLLLICSSGAFAQSITVTGLVKDSHGETLIGVSVRVKGGGAGTATNVDGKYKITVKDKQTVLIFSYIGFTSVEETVNDRTSINVTLPEEPKNLNEVVVLGYGQVRRRDLTGSVSTVDIDDLNKAPVKSFDDALAGRVAGVQVTSPDGQPGAAPTIVIRGGN